MVCNIIARQGREQGFADPVPGALVSSRNDPLAFFGLCTAKGEPIEDVESSAEFAGHQHFTSCNIWRQHLGVADPDPNAPAPKIRTPMDDALELMGI